MNTHIKVPALEKARARLPDKNGLKIVIATSCSPLFIQYLLNSHHSIIGLIDFSSHSERNLISDLIYRFKKLTGRCEPDLQEIAKKNNLPILHQPLQKNNELEEFLENLKPDVLITHTCGILPRNVFNIPRYKTINIHLSLLPKYRGAYPQFWAAYHGESDGGITIHTIDDGVDTGPILGQEIFPLNKGFTETEYMNKAFKKEPQLLLHVLNDIENEITPPYVQPKESPTPYAKRVSFDDLKCMISDSSHSIEQIWRITRYLQNRPDLFPEIPGWRRYLRWIVCDYDIVNQPEQLPGKICKDKNGYYLAHTNGKIRLRQKLDLKFILRKLLNNNSKRESVIQFSL